ncbi:hypothetical protein vBEcoMWL3_gp049 [Escherichia phage vB_EcoM_WL-3]|nr:hypothetical protein vBEcoMWL3_gp049 [Escherichia phage vB_EcoM_WL-3]
MYSCGVIAVILITNRIFWNEFPFMFLFKRNNSEVIG